MCVCVCVCVCVYMCVCVLNYIYIYIYGETIDMGESDKMIRIRGKVEKSNFCNGFSGNISFFINSLMKVFY